MAEKQMLFSDRHATYMLLNRTRQAESVSLCKRCRLISAATGHCYVSVLRDSVHLAENHFHSVGHDFVTFFVARHREAKRQLKTRLTNALDAIKPGISQTTGRANHHMLLGATNRYIGLLASVLEM